MARIEGADISIQDFLEENKDLSQSNLQQAYEKSSVLLTGVTSFIGSVVLEKLLRSCPEIDCVYVLIRSRDRKEPVERIEDLFKSPLFDRLKMEYPTTLNKVHVIQCDFYEGDLGISNEDYLLLTSKINCVIHAAKLIGSTVKFKEAVLINLKALQNILKLCNEMKKLDAVSYVSNIFGHFNEAVVEEKLYPCSLTGDCLINMVHNLSDETLEAITPGITGDYPNVSLLTLAVAENILKEKGEGLPLCIVRPPFVLASCNEPIAGWIQTQRQESPTDILLNVFLGKLFNIHCDSTYLTEAVPVDMVANFIIAVSGSLLLRRKDWINQAVIIQSNCKKNSMVQNDLPDIQIYNLISSNKHKLSWAEFFKNSIKHEKEVPFLDTIWYSSLKMNKHWVVHWLLTWLQLGQVVLFDNIKGVFGINSELLETVKQLQNMSDTVLKFCKKQWRLKDDNVVNLWESMSIADRNHFDFNLKALDWNQFFYTQCRGLRVYLMNDPLSTVPDAQKNRKRMKTTYSLFTSVLLILLCYIIYKMLS